MSIPLTDPERLDGNQGGDLGSRRAQTIEVDRKASGRAAQRRSGQSAAGLRIAIQDSAAACLDCRSAKDGQSGLPDFSVVPPQQDCKSVKAGYVNTIDRPRKGRCTVNSQF